MVLNLKHGAVVAALSLFAPCVGVACSSPASEDDTGDKQNITTTHDACEVLCDVLIDCGPTWAHEFQAQENCSWKFGDEAALDRCMMSCEKVEVEGYQENSEIRCILCMVEEVGDACGNLSDAVESCPCVFDVEEYGAALPPEIEPLACDGGDEYIFGGNEVSAENRERCLAGDTIYCR